MMPVSSVYRMGFFYLILERWKENDNEDYVYGYTRFCCSMPGKLIQSGYEVTAVITQPDRPKGRKKELSPTPVKEAAQKHGILVLQPEKLRNEAEVQRVAALKPRSNCYGSLWPNPSQSNY